KPNGTVRTTGLPSRWPRSCSSARYRLPASCDSAPTAARGAGREEAADAALHRSPPALRHPDPDRRLSAHLLPLLYVRFAGADRAPQSLGQKPDAEADSRVAGAAWLRQAALRAVSQAYHRTVPVEIRQLGRHQPA